MLTREAAQSGGRRTMVALAMLVASVLLLMPFVSSIGVIMLLITIALSGVATTVGLNIALLSDLLRSRGDAGRATGLLILGGNIFGILAPIVTGYVIQLTGSFDYAFVIAGGLLVCGALSALLMTRRPIGASQPGHRADLTIQRRLIEGARSDVLPSRPRMFPPPSSPGCRTNCAA